MASVAEQLASNISLSALKSASELKKKNMVHYSCFNCL